MKFPRSLFYLGALLAVTPYFVGSQTKISQLPSASAITGTEILPIVQNGQTVQVSTNQLNLYFTGKLPYTLNANNQTNFYGATSGPTVSIDTYINATDALQIYAQTSANRASIVFVNNTLGNNGYVGMDGGNQILADSASGDMVIRTPTGASTRFGRLSPDTSDLRIGPAGGVVAGVGSDLGLGTVNAVNGFFVNGSPVIYSGTSGSLGGGSLAAGACSTTNVTISGVTTSMVANVSPNTYPGNGNYWNARVSSANTVAVYVCASIAQTPTASTYNVRVTP